MDRRYITFPRWILFYVAVYSVVWRKYSCSATNGIGNHREQIRIGVIQRHNSDILVALKRTWHSDPWRRVHVPAHATPVSFLDIQIGNTTEARNLSYILSRQKVLQSMNLTFLVGEYDSLVHLTSDSLRIPYIITRTHGHYDWRDAGGKQTCAVPLTTNPTILHQAVYDLAMRYHWKTIGVIYDSTEGLQLIEKFLQLSHLDVQVCRISKTDKHTSLNSCLLRMRGLVIRHLIISCEKKFIPIVMSRALRLSMLTYQYTWMFADTESFVIDLNDYSESGATLISFKPSTNSIAESRLFSRDPIQKSLELVMASLASERNWDKATQTMSSERTHSLDLCQKVTKLAANLLTGSFPLPSTGKIPHHLLTIISYRENEWAEIGNWTIKNGSITMLTLSKDTNTTNIQLLKRYKSLSGRTLRVVTIQETPFLMLKKDHSKRKGNDRYEGFLMDMLAVMEKNLNFKSEIYEVPDNTYGSFQNGEWNGMVREIIDGRADLILSALAITSQRESVIDFTKPFGEMRLSILMKKPDVKSSIFQFLWPISASVWLTVLAVWLASSVVLFVIDKFSPNSDDSGVDMFTWNNSVWFMYTSLVGCGSDAVPKTWSARIISGVWWFVSLILISSYTANLAAFLTITKIESPIRSLSDLGNQDRIQYGSVKKSYPASFFERSKLNLLQKMWQYMSEVHPELLVDSVEEGVARVKQGNYAFIWDHNGNEYVRDNDCQTMIVGEPFSWRVYGIGVPMDAAYREDVSIEILKLQEHGIFNQIRLRWWHKSNCEDLGDKAPTRTQELTLHNLAGVFVVLTIGCVVALAVCFVEFLYNRSKPRKKAIKTSKSIENNDTTRVALKANIDSL